MSKAPIILGGILAGCILIVTIVLISCSFARVEMTEIGLLYSHASRKIDRSRTYGAGRWYVGVGGEFIKYPITQQEMHLPQFESRTFDGLLVTLDVSLNFKVGQDPEKLLKIFDDFGYHYDGFISRLATNIIRDASARYTAFSYSMNRSQVNAEMERDIADDMLEIGFSLDSLQLLNIEFPVNFSNTLQYSRMLQQQVSQAQMNMAAEEVSLEGEYLKSNVTAQGILYDAESQAISTIQNAEAQAQSLIASLQQEGASHANMIAFFKSLPEFSTLEEAAKEAAAQKKFVDWYWLNQVSSTAAAKNIAVSLPKVTEEAA